MTNRLKLSDLWSESIAICRADFAVLAPVAVSFMGVSSFFMGLVQPVFVLGRLQVGLWMMAPVLLLMWGYVGTLTIAALVVRRGGPTVGQALREISPLLSVVAMLFILLALALTLLSLPLGLVTALILGRTPGGMAAVAAGQLPSSLIFLVLALLLVGSYLMVRLFPIWAVLVSERKDAISTVKRTFQLTRGQAPRLFALVAGVLGLSLIVQFALTRAVGSLLLLAGRLLGQQSLAGQLVDVLSALVAAVFAMLLTVAGVVVYRRLTAR